MRLMAVLAADDEGADRRCSGPILTRNPRADGGPGSCWMSRGSDGGACDEDRVCPVGAVLRRK